MILKDLKERLNEFDENQEIFISYSDNGETLTIVDIDRESGVISPDHPTLFLYADEINEFHKKVEKDLINQKVQALHNHFGINPSDVKLPTENDYDDEFLITFDTKAPNVPEPKWYSIEVIDEEIKNENEIYLGEGTYTKLNNSEFYFRWL